MSVPRSGVLDARVIDRTSLDRVISTTISPLDTADWLGNHRVSVVIPARDEAACLPHVLPRLPDWVDEVLLVDGESTDGTIEVAHRLRPDIRIVMQEGCGKGAALRTGITTATGDIIVLLDADGSTDPSEIPAFVGALLAGADFAKGSRFLQGAGSRDMTSIRRFGNWGFAVLANLLFQTRFSDLTYGYNALWARNRWSLALEIDGWPHEIISNIRVARSGLKVVEVASFEHARVAGEAKLRLIPAAVAILAAIVAEWFRQRQASPTEAVAERTGAVVAAERVG
jgi:glycosyltransferase involved in cell wall biosynthesis